MSSQTSKATRRSQLAQRDDRRGGPAGFQRNPQDFSDLVGQKAGSRQEFLRKHWDYLPERMREKAESLSSSFKGVPIDRTGQFALGF